MKLNRLETHDRLLHFKKDQETNIFQGAEDCLKKNQLSISLQQYSPYIYIWAHPRSTDDGLNKRMIWQPRLTKPTAQSNSYLFRAISNTDSLEVCWLIPQRELWKQYLTGQMMENDLAIWSIWQFKNNKKELENPHPDDLSEQRCKQIYMRIATEIDEQIKTDKINQVSSEEPSASLMLPWKFQP